MSWPEEEIEAVLIAWAEEEGERHRSLDAWHLNDEQMETIREASAIEHEAACLANAMSYITNEEGMVLITKGANFACDPICRTLAPTKCSRQLGHRLWACLEGYRDGMMFYQLSMVRFGKCRLVIGCGTASDNSLLISSAATVIWQEFLKLE
ncbi:MAG: hypothetical protein ABJF28_07280 [Nisaea sp.]|uniref:hypothetical protein n=1 Tax=Alphaproteobacteria TaxID=28211 RepID=UPI003262E378